MHSERPARSQARLELEDDGRRESTLERLDRNTVELLNELRVAGTGIQVILAFLLVVPFNNGWRRVTSFERYDYFATLVSMALAAVLLIAPSIYHRILFRCAQKEYIVTVGNTMAILAMGFMTLGLTGVLVLISGYVFGTVAAAVAGALTATFVTALWFVIPLHRRSRI